MSYFGQIVYELMAIICKFLTLAENYNYQLSEDNVMDFGTSLVEWLVPST